MRISQKRNVAHFNSTAHTYDRNFGDALAATHEAVADLVARHSPEPRLMLDIGCGTGGMLALAAARWPDATLVGVDPAERMLDILTERVPGVRAQVGYAERLPVDSAAVDVVLSTASFGHWDDKGRALAEVVRVLRPGGRCYIAEHPPPGWLRRLMYRLPDFRSAAETGRLLAADGLVVEEAGEVADMYTLVARKPSPSNGVYT